MKEYVGSSVQRSRIVDKVTGAQRYICDRKMPGMLSARLLRSEYGSADILELDVSEAIISEGVVTVLTARDIEGPMPCFGSVYSDQPILADQDVKYQGEALAVVVAQSHELAQKAVEKIKVKYKPKRAVTTLQEALDPEAPLVNPTYHNRPGKPYAKNVMEQFSYGWGEVAEAREAAAYIVKNRYSFPMVYHFSLENYGCVAAVEDGELTVWTPIQHPFILRRVLSTTFGIPQSKIRVVAEEIGGGFGGKGYPKVEPIAAYLALKLKRPVKIELNFHEGFYSARRLSNETLIETGFTKEGKILFQNIQADYLIGPYASEGPRIAQKAGYLACGAYRTENASIQVRVVQSNTTSSTAFRGFGMPQLIWALERQLDAAAKTIGIDRLQLRRMNLPGKGEVLVPGDTPADGHWMQGFDKAVEMIGFHQPKKPGQGRGIAIGIKNPIPGSRSNALVRLHADGSATGYVGTTDMGQGSRTTMAQIMAEVLQIPVEKIKVHMGDTLTVPFDQATAGSRSTVSMGNALQEACRHINSQLTAKVSDHFQVSQEQFTLQDGKIHFSDRAVSYTDFFLSCYGPFQADLVGVGVFQGKKDKSLLLGGTADFWEVVFTAVDLTVDKRLGTLRINKIVNVTDGGKIINPLQAEGQEAGGTIIALGHTLMEQMIYSPEGRLLNGDPLNYSIPTTKDIPEEMDSCFIENQDGPGPFGAKGLGESSVIALAAAIGNAVEDAVGISFHDLPITKEKLFFKLREREGSLGQKA